MNYIHDILEQLSSRLPELEWKISRLNTSFVQHSIPKGLFRSYTEFSGSAYVAEIKSDIRELSKQENELSARYLAARIQQKINVLVALCQKQGKKPEEKVSFGIKMLSTRQQWIQSLEADINTLDKQQQAMVKALEQKKISENSAAKLSVQAELGEIERRLTLAREELKRVVS